MVDLLIGLFRPRCKDDARKDQLFSALFSLGRTAGSLRAGR